jgi:hypothetical protein
VPEQRPRRLRGAELVEHRLTVHARKTAGAISLCGQDPGWGEWSNRRSKVTCKVCLDIIAQRLADRGKPR